VWRVEEISRVQEVLAIPASIATSASVRISSTRVKPLVRAEYRIVNIHVGGLVWALFYIL
jgi:hypothetical protein